MSKRYSDAFPHTNSPRLRRTLIVVFVVVTLILLYNGLQFYHGEGPLNEAQAQPHYSSLHKNASDVALVISKTKEEDVGWVSKFCNDFACTPYIYTLEEEPEEGYLIPYTINGHEASAYLTYIVDYYEELHPFTIFIHGKEEHWHNDAGGPKTFNQLPNLRFEAVKRKGFANLRCLTMPGCPNSLQPSIVQKTDLDYQHVIDNFPEVWSEIFGVDPSTAPLQLGHHCCGQFAVTKERILEKPIASYDRMLQWVAKNKWTDSYGTGWLMEKLWHVTFGMPAVNCGPVPQCRCDLYGWCGPNPETGGAILTPLT